MLILVLCLTLLLTGDIRKVHIIHTADIHAHLNPDEQGQGGWLKAASLIRQLRQQLGTRNSLLIDCGDTVQGTLGASLSKGLVGIPPLDALQYDAWIPGNHELDYGISQFLTFMEMTRDVHICGNLVIRGHAPYPAWKLFVRNGVRIALIGINSSFLKNWQLPQDADRLIITPASKFIPNVLDEIRPHHPHLIILAAHQGWFRGFDPRHANEINDIAWDFPEIDLILGAHTHRLIPGAKIGRRSWYVQPGAHASHVSHITVTVHTDHRTPPHIVSRTIPVDPSLQPDPDLTERMKPFLEQERRERSRIIDGFLGQRASSKGLPGKNCETSELLARAIAWKTKASVAFHGKLTNCDLPAGTITLGDLHDVSPYDNTIVTAMLTASQIQDILNEQLKWKKQYSFNGIYGLKTKRDNQGRLILDKQDSRLPADPNQRLKVAFNSHAAAGSGRFLILRDILADPASQTRNHPITTLCALEEFLAHHKGIVISPIPWLAK